MTPWENDDFNKYSTYPSPKHQTITKKQNKMTAAPQHKTKTKNS